MSASIRKRPAFGEIPVTSVQKVKKITNGDIVRQTLESPAPAPTLSDGPANQSVLETSRSLTMPKPVEPPVSSLKPPMSVRKTPAHNARHVPLGIACNTHDIGSSCRWSDELSAALCSRSTASIDPVLRSQKLTQGQMFMIDGKSYSVVCSLPRQRCNNKDCHCQSGATYLIECFDVFDEADSRFVMFVGSGDSGRMHVAIEMVLSSGTLHMFDDMAVLLRPQIPSVTLSQVLAMPSYRNGVDESLAIHFTIELCKSVMELHKRGMIHCTLNLDHIVHASRDNTVSLVGMSHCQDMDSTTPMVSVPQYFKSSVAYPLKQVDYFAVAQCLYKLTFGMTVELDSKMITVDPSTNRYKLIQAWPKYYASDMWNSVYDLLLNGGDLSKVMMVASGVLDTQRQRSVRQLLNKL